MNEQTIYDITIIGGGPIGLFTAFYAHLRNAKVKIIDSLHQLGGQPAILYPEKAIFDIPAYPELTGEQLINQLLAQLQRFDTTICLNETMLTFDKQDDIFEITTTVGKHYSKTIIIAMGAGAFSPRTLELDNASQFKNLHYTVSNVQQYANQHIAICGGGDSAVDWALTFEPIAKSVTIIHRRPEFRAMEHSVMQLQASSVTIQTPYLPSKLIGNGDTLTAVEITKVRDTEVQTIPVDHFFVNYGFKSSTGNLKHWQLDLQRDAIVVNSKQETSMAGVYAVGDCCVYPGKVQIIAAGLGEAPTAVNNAMTYINPNERVQPMHSSSLFH